jgi:uncharacterized protein (TIGR02246 family)
MERGAAYGSLEKRMIRLVCTVTLAIGLAAPCAAGPAEDVAAATKTWTERFSTHDLEGLLALYDRDAVFWGTSSQVIRDTPGLIRDYFKGVPTSSMTVAVTDSRVRVVGTVAINSGSYTFTAMRNGQPDPRPARFSFTYRLRDGTWLIVDHHSSSVPGAPRQ